MRYKRLQCWFAVRNNQLKRLTNIATCLILLIVLPACGGGNKPIDDQSADADGSGDDVNSGTCAEPEEVMVFSGLESENFGAVMWNADSAAPEPAKAGHLVNICNHDLSAYYYLASREHVDSSKVGGLRGKETLSMPHFSAALASNGFTVDQLTVTWGVATLGPDREGEDWAFEDLVETRYYTSGQRTLFLNGEPLVTSALPKLKITVDYGEECDVNDDIVAGISDFGPIDDASTNSSSPVQSVAAAFLADVNTRNVAFDFVSIQRATRSDFSNNNGRTGAYFDIPNMKMLAKSSCP